MQLEQLRDSLNAVNEGLFYGEIEFSYDVMGFSMIFTHPSEIIGDMIGSVVKGEYLAWFSEGLTLIDCKIIGTQPLCYCKNLKLINCTMEDCDLSFEYSDVDADVKGHIVSVKNPKSGKIVADSVGEIIFEDAVMETDGQVIIR